MTLRKGFVSYDRRDYTESIVYAGELGFDYVEIMMDGDSRREVLEAERDHVTTLLEDHDLDVVVHLPFPTVIGSPHEYQRVGAITEMKACIEAAVAIGAEKGTMHPDSYGWIRVWDKDRVTPILTAAIRELDAFAKQRGFQICVENLFQSYLDIYDVYDFEVLFEGTEVSMTLDTGHAAIAGMSEVEMATFVAEHTERVRHIHLNDTRHLDVGYRAKDEHLPLGYGTQDFETILAPVTEHGWDGTLSIELDTPDFDYLRASKERLDRWV